MLLRDVITYQKERLRNPWVWVPTLGLGACFLLANLSLLLSQGQRSHPAAWALLLLTSLAFPALFLWLAPAPWLWTRGRATHAPLTMGAIQSAAFASLYLILLGGFQIGVSMVFKLNLGGTLRQAFGALASILIFYVPAAMLAGYFTTLWERTRIAKQEAERRLREAQWVLLRGQLSPHVLFNALNNLAEMVRQDPIAAEQALLDLADLYRSLLDHGSRPWTPLSEERRLVDRYLSVESMRLGSRLRVDWDWDENLARLETPPFLIQPLVENALKHGISPHPAGGTIRIALRKEDTDRVIRVANTGRPLPLVPGNGVGVQNLEARLNLAFGDRARLRLFTDGEWTVGEIRIHEEAA